MQAVGKELAGPLKPENGFSGSEWLLPVAVIQINAMILRLVLP